MVVAAAASEMAAHTLNRAIRTLSLRSSHLIQASPLIPTTRTTLTTLTTLTIQATRAIRTAAMAMMEATVATEAMEETVAEAAMIAAVICCRAPSTSSLVSRATVSAERSVSMVNR